MKNFFYSLSLFLNLLNCLSEFSCSMLIFFFCFVIGIFSSLSVRSQYSLPLSLVAGCPGERHFVRYKCTISCKLKGREKRNDICHHDADVTPQ